MRISDWSSDVCSSDLPVLRREASKRGQPLVDHTLLCDAELASDRRHQLADQAPQKDKIARTIVECPQGRETCRLPILQRQIDPARRPDINLRATVLVDEDLLRARFLELRHQKILDDGLARAGRTDNQCVTQIADME